MPPPSIPYVRILLVGNENIGKRSLLESFFNGRTRARHLWRFSRYRRIQVPDKVPDVLFETAGAMRPRAIGVQSLMETAVDGLTMKEIWGFEDPWELWGRWAMKTSLPLEEECTLISPQVIGICFSIGDHKALDGVRDKV
jgi:hypothetical protein